MGKIASKVIRPVKNFNVENRAQRVLDSNNPRPAPRHPSTVSAIDSFAKGHPDFLDEQKKKHEKLDEFLKKVRVDSMGDNPEIKTRRPLPENRTKTTPAEFGLPDPETVTKGHASLRQALEFISLHHLDPVQNSAEKISTDYRLDPGQVAHILKYFQTLELHIPAEMKKKNPKLMSLMSSLDTTAAQRQTLKGMEEVAKLGAGGDVSAGEEGQKTK